jgi:hypothetical protein
MAESLAALAGAEVRNSLRVTADAADPVDAVMR